VKTNAAFWVAHRELGEPPQKKIRKNKESGKSLFQDTPKKRQEGKYQTKRTNGRKSRDLGRKRAQKTLRRKRRLPGKKKAGKKILKTAKRELASWKKSVRLRMGC